MFELLGLARDLMPVVESGARNARAGDWGGLAHDGSVGLEVISVFLKKKFPVPPPTVGGGEDPPALVGASRGPLRRLGESIYLRAVRREVNRRLSTEGFALVADRLAVQGIVAPPGGLGASAGGYSESQIAGMWAKARPSGLTDEAILAYSESEVTGLGDGRILEALAGIWQWIVDHQEEILAVVKFVLMLLAMFGI